MSQFTQQMINKSYNGWSSEIRTVRGTLFYNLVRKGVLPRAKACELCGSTQGLTFHAEEYGSTWSDYLQSCHALCCYCHATVHVRHRYPNRWSRFVQRAISGEMPEFPYTSMSEVYGAYRTIKDLDEPVPAPAGDHWLLKLPVMGYDGIPKVALAEELQGLVPDFKIYPGDLQTLSGMRYEATTATLTPYEWSLP